MNPNKLRIFSYLILSGIFMYSCGSGPDCENLIEYDTSINDVSSDSFQAIIEDYNSLDSNFEVETELNRENEIYVDLSDGITKYALGNENNTRLFKNFLTSISNENDVNKYYELSNDSILPYLGDAHIQYFLGSGHTTMDGKLKQGAPLDAAINRIASQNNLSVLVTDGELYDKSLRMISMEMWASKALTNWFKKGHKLSVVYSNFSESNNGKTYKKHMYFMFFVPKNYEGTLLSNFMSDLDSDKSLSFDRLDFSISLEDLFTRRYANAQLPGAPKYIKDFDPNPAAYFSENAFEYVDLTTAPFTVDPDEYGLVSVLRDLGDDNGRPKNFPLLEKLFIDFNRFNNYKVNKVAIEVSNVSDDFKAFKRHYYAKRATPEILKNAEGKDSLSMDNYLEFDECISTVDGEIAYDLLNKTQEDIKNDFASMLSDEFRYPQDPVFRLNDFIEIDETAGKVNEINDENGEYEIILKFSPKLNNQTLGLSTEGNNLVKIDIIIEDLELIPLNQEALTWNKISEDGIDETFYRSLRNTLTSIAPTGATLYTYYIQLGPFNN